MRPHGPTAQGQEDAPVLGKRSVSWTPLISRTGPRRSSATTGAGSAHGRADPRCGNRRPRPSYGADVFASRHVWGRRAAYQSQFHDPIGRALQTQAKIKARLIGDLNPDDWDLPPKPKRMRSATYNRMVAKFDQAEEVKDDQLMKVVARFGRL